MNGVFRTLLLAAAWAFAGSGADTDLVATFLLRCSASAGLAPTLARVAAGLTGVAAVFLAVMQILAGAVLGRLSGQVERKGGAT